MSRFVLLNKHDLIIGHDYNHGDVQFPLYRPDLEDWINEHARLIKAVHSTYMPENHALIYALEFFEERDATWFRLKWLCG